MDNPDIASVLAQEGRRIFESPRGLVPFTGDEQVDSFMNDIVRYPHAFVFGCILDRQVKAELAWEAPYRLAQRIGGFEVRMLEALSGDDFYRLMTRPDPLHRFPKEMSQNLYEAVLLIKTLYASDAARIWSGRPPSATVVYRFLQFRGVGLKIASMAANALAQELKVQFSDYFSIDISTDVHVRRVFTRLGLIKKGASNVELIYLARSMSPEFPGLLDLPTFNIGRQWCKPSQPLCSECYMSALCATAQGALVGA